MDGNFERLDWSLVQAFLAVAEAGSLSGGARVLGISQPTLGRHVARLEAETGLTLFARQPRGLDLTEAGQALLPCAQRMAAAMAEMALAAAGRDDALTGTVRITASEVVAHHILPGIMARVLQEAPGIALEIDASDETGNLLFREADIAVRMYRPEQLDIVTRHLGGIEIGCFAARSYLDRAGWPAGPEDLAGHALIGFDRSELMLRGMRAAGWQVQREDFTLRTDDQVAYFEYLRAGCGIGFFQAEVARRTEGIEEIPLGIPVPPLPVWIAAHEKVRRIPRVDLVWRMLEGGLAPFLQRG